MTSCPASARQLPVTKPTYPQPITARRTLSSSRQSVSAAFFERSRRERSKLHESQCSCHPPVRSSYRWITGGRQRDTSGEESSDLAASKGLVSKPRSPINKSRGWLRHTCQSRRAASSRLKRLNELRIRSFIQSTRRL